MTRTCLQLALLLLISCKRTTDTPATPAWPDRRTTCNPPSAPRADWSHRRSTLVAASGAPQHVAGDTILTAGASATLRGKFAYGDLSKDLEDEPIHVHVSDGGMTGGEVGGGDLDATVVVGGLGDPLLRKGDCPRASKEPDARGHMRWDGRRSSTAIAVTRWTSHNLPSMR